MINEHLYTYVYINKKRKYVVLSKARIYYLTNYYYWYQYIDVLENIFMYHRNIISISRTYSINNELTVHLDNGTNFLILILEI